MFNPKQIEALQAKLDKAHVKSRTQAGRSLSYIEGWHAIAEANRIFGFGHWCRYTDELRQLGEPRVVEDKFRVYYMAKVRIVVDNGEGSQIIREGCGYGSGIDKDLGQAHESALKESETDAMKRALMTFGNPFGLALYDKEQANVEAAPPPPAKPSPAAEYVARSLEIIDVAMTKQNLRDWWKSEAPRRREVGLRQADVDQLAEAMTKKAATFTDEPNTLLGAA